jgi:hypothetical protein
MRTKKNTVILLIALLMLGATACGRTRGVIAPEIPAAEDLIPAYIPEGFELVSGFEIAGDSAIPDPSADDLRSSDSHRKTINLRSPVGEDVVGVYYQGKDQLILITRSAFPEGTLDLWKSGFEGSFGGPLDCDCPFLQKRAFPLSSDAGFRSRLPEVQETRTIQGTSVAILETPEGWITVFIRGDDLLTVESGISLAENLKIVASLLDG